MKSKNDIDPGILKRLKTGDVDAFEYIFRKYNGKIYHFALATLYDKTMAEDITQNVFLSVWEHRQNIIPEKNFRAYLYTIAKNLIYRETEKMILAFRYEEYMNKEHSGEEDFSTEKTIDANSLEEMIFRLIDKLPNARRKIFLLHFADDLSNKEIAKKLSVTEENVETQVKRSLDYIRRFLKKYIALYFGLFLWRIF